MSAQAASAITNHLLQLLTSYERQLLLQHCEVVKLQFADILCEPHQPYRYLYFPLSGFISLVTKLADHEPLEMGLIGNEGMLGVTLALGVSTAPMQAVVQGKGTAWRIAIADLKECLRRCPQLLQVLQQYLFVQLAQLAQSAACVHFHELSPRLARWLLMSDDRAHSGQFYLTHQFLAGMLGVRRSGVTVAAGIMQQQQVISYNRGMITIIDRKALQNMACECYQSGLDNYRNMLGKPEAETPLRQLCQQGQP